MPCENSKAITCLFWQESPITSPTSSLSKREFKKNFLHQIKSTKIFSANKSQLRIFRKYPKTVKHITQKFNSFNLFRNSFDNFHKLLEERGIYALRRKTRHRKYFLATEGTAKVRVRVK